MNFLKFLIFSFAFCSLITAEENGGWFAVEKVPEPSDPPEERDPSIWVLFSKSLGTEKILVRMPEEPTYRYSEAGDLEIVSERDGEIFQLFVYPLLSSRSYPDLLYLADGKWVREHFIQTEHHLFRFKTFCKEHQSPSHHQFISSFLIEKNG